MKTRSRFALLFLAGGATATLPVAAADPPLSHEEIKTVVDSHLAEIKGCMGEHGGATGKLVVEFGILPNGKVTDAKPKERSSNAPLDKCIAKAFGGWTFPKPRGNITMGVNYPFIFSAPPPPPPQGKLEDKQIADVVHAKKADVDACYASAIKDKPGLQGTVRVAFVIAPTGKVTEAKLHEGTTTASPMLESCLVEKLKSWQFPAPAGNGEFAVIYPFIFASKGAPAAGETEKTRQGQQAGGATFQPSR